LPTTYAYASIYRVTDCERGTMNANKDAISTQTALGSGVLLQQDWTLDGVHKWNSNDHCTGGSTSTESRDHIDFSEADAVTGTPYGGTPTRTDQHEDNGNLTDDGTLTYEWDAKNRLRQVTRKSDSKLAVEYTYDCHKRRFRGWVVLSGVWWNSKACQFDGGTDEQ